MERLTTFTRKARIFQNKIIFNWTPLCAQGCVIECQYSPNPGDLCEEVDCLAALAAADLLQFIQLASGQDLINLLGYLITNALLKQKQTLQVLLASPSQISFIS
jgi:hypothetical protein